jgi:hypothetical protein
VKQAEKTIDLREKYKPTSRQTIAHTVPERFILYGGAMGGGKTVWLCNEGLQLSLDYPGNVGYLCRQELTSFRRSTGMTLGETIPNQLIKIHHQTESYYQLINGSIIFYGGLGDDQKAIDRLKSMNLGWFGIDQAEEVSESHFLLLASRLRLILPYIKYKGLLSANPAPGWVKHRFIEQKLPDHVFIPALPKDNPYLPGDYESTLQELYKGHEELIRAWLNGDWDALESGNYLFKYKDIKDAIERDVKDGDKTKVIGVDLARFGDDNSVACVREGCSVIWLEQWAKTDLMTSTGKVVNLIQRFSPDAVNIDVIGIGAGVVDRLKEQKFHVNGVNVAEAASDKLKYANVRAEAYWQLAERFQKCEINIPDDLEVIAQLSSIKYKFDSHGRLQIEAKEDMKKRGLKSPDKADSLVLAFMESPNREIRIRWL